MSIKCPVCQSVAHTRSSRYIHDQLMERYLQCRNLECSATFVSHETIARVLVKPQPSGDGK